MDAHDNELDEIRHQWQSLKVDRQRLEQANRRLSQRLSAERAVSKQKRLSNYYRRIGIASVIILPILAVPLYYIVGMPLWVSLLYAAVGIALGTMNLRFSMFISDTDYITMPTCDAMIHARRVLLWQARLRNLGIILATVVLVPIFMYLYALNNTSGLTGGIAGGAVGVAIGFALYCKKRRAARNMLSDLESDPD